MPRPTTLEALAVRYARPQGERWGPVPPELDAAIAADGELAEAARRAREALVEGLAQRFHFGERLLEAVREAPRERFVLPEDIGESAEDRPMPLDEAGRATVSAPHAYLLTYELLELGAGDHLLELGTGTGYGAALGRRLVGPEGHVTSIEIDPGLHARARRLLVGDGAGAHQLTLLCGDGRSLAEQLLAWAGPADAPSGSIPLKIAVTYALREAPEALSRLLPEGGCLVAPVATGKDYQELTRITRRGGALRREDHGAVRYVPERA